MTPRNAWLRRLLGILIAGVLSGCSTSPEPSFDTLHHATVLVEHAKGHGTGAIVGPNAVLTADHVVGIEPLSVTFFDGRVAEGRVRWRDPLLDVALLKVAVPDGYAASRLFCGDLASGQHLLLIGHPTQSRWVAVGGYLPATGPLEGDLVSLGFPIGLGTSGGPVFDAEGRIVGVALAILAERASATARFDEFKDTGIGLMLPASRFCSELEALQRLRANRRR
jgi:S1-C subfamily serine protease